MIAVVGQNKMMMKKQRAIPCILTIVALLLAGCVGVSLGTPRIWQERQIKTLESADRLILLTWVRRSAHESSDRYDIELLKGEYRLRAEDNNYLYYECQEKIHLVVQKAGKQADGRYMKGGIFIAKPQTNASYPGGAYIDWDDGKKLLLVSFDSDFFGFEGKCWHYERQNAAQPTAAASPSVDK